MSDELKTLLTRWSMLDQLQGDEQEEAWRWFEATYGGFVNDCLRRHLRGERLQRAQESFWSYLFTSGVISRADRDRRFRALLFGTLRNYVRSFLRDDHYQQFDHETDDGDLHIAPGVEDHQAETEDMRAFAAASLSKAMSEVGRKAPRQMKVLTEFYGIGQSPRGVREIAADLDIKDNALHQLLMRARRSLRDSFVEVLRNTVSTPAQLDEELELMLETLFADHPGIFDR